jgi:hypothetical protein
MRLVDYRQSRADVDGARIGPGIYAKFDAPAMLPLIARTVAGGGQQRFG